MKIDFSESDLDFIKPAFDLETGPVKATEEDKA